MALIELIEEPTGDGAPPPPPSSGAHLSYAGASRVLTAPALWIVLEWLRTFFPAAFPWGFVGYSQARMPLVAQAADVAGVYRPNKGVLADVPGAGGVSPLEVVGGFRGQEALYASSWFRTITAEVYG